jgi:chromosome segregation ATPase
MGIDQNELDHIEQDINAIRFRLQKFFETLDKLSTIQEKFIDLTEVYQNAKANLGDTETQLEEIKQIRLSYSELLSKSERQFEGALENLSQKNSQIETYLNEAGNKYKVELAAKHKELFSQEQELYKTRLENLEEMYQAFDLSIKKNNTFIRNLNRDLQNITRVGTVSLVGIVISLIVTWIIFSR